MTATLSRARVLILVQNLPVPFDRRVWQEATTLARAGADVTVICPGDDAHPVGRFVLNDVTVVRYAAPAEASGPLGYFREYGPALARMRQAVRSERERRGPFAVVHFCNPPDLLYLVARPLKRSDRTLLVFDQHDLGPELVEAKHMPLSPLFVRVARFFEAQTYRAADHVIATNRSYRDIAVTRGGFTDDEVTVIRSGPSRTWADDVPTADWHRGRKHLIGYLGVMGRQEGVEYLLDATRVLVDEHGLDVHLSLIGSGPDRDRLEQLATDLRLGDRVEFHGRLPDETMKSILSDADVCVNPDEVNAMNDLSTMNKIIEYMALGRPIVQFDVREGRFSAMDASRYAAANDADALAGEIATVLTSERDARQMGEFGRRRFTEELCWDHQGELLVAAYERLLRRRL